MIEIEDLSITFGEGASAVHAVRNVSFSVAEGESYGLVGESEKRYSSECLSPTRLLALLVLRTALSLLPADACCR